MRVIEVQNHTDEAIDDVINKYTMYRCRSISKPPTSMLPSRDASPNDDEEEENEQTEENVMFSSLMKLCLERERERDCI